MSRWLWWTYLAAGAAAIGCYLLAPAGIVQDSVYELVGLSCVAAIGWGVRLHRPAQRLPWLFMLFGELCWAVGDALDSWRADVEHVSSFPSLVDVFYLGGYPLLAVALALLIRGRRPRRDLAGFLDSTIVTAGFGVLFWVVLAHPTLAAAHYSSAAGIVSIAYPAADVLLLGGLVRLNMTPGARTTSYRLLFTATGLLIAGDTAQSALNLWAAGGTAIYNAIWLASYVVWGSAALHPSMRSLSLPVRGDDVRFTRRRLGVLALASLVAPVTLAVQHVAALPVDYWAVIIGSVVIFLLVVARMSVAINQIVAAQNERGRLQADLAHQATHDALTDLPNRVQALTAIQAALSRAQRSGDLTGLLFVDLDGFKGVNDAHGHAAGDLVLREVAQRLHAAVRGGDLVARLGGDEFVILLEQLSTEADALHVAQRVIHSVAEPIVLSSDTSATVGASVGMAVCQDGSTDPDRLLHEADTAVYRAKAGGRGRVEVFGDVLRRELAAHSDLEVALKLAIARDELVVFYQPIISLATGHLQGYEALVRWRRPGHGLLAPAAFIPVAETSNLICDLDAWVLQRATHQLAVWTREGAGPLTVAVNVSGRHVSAPRILGDVRAALAASGLDPAQLVLEVTETVLVDDLAAIHHLHLLRELGVAISIDDFGTGYSSISRLRHYPIDIIKIDRSFLDTTHQSSRALLELMIKAAHTFELPVIVEGVEHAHQLETLRSIGCESAQGFHIAHPLPADQARPSAHPTPVERHVRS